MSEIRLLELEPGAWNRRIPDHLDPGHPFAVGVAAVAERLLAAVSAEPRATGGTLAGKVASRGTGKLSLAAV